MIQPQVILRCSLRVFDLINDPLRNARGKKLTARNLFDEFTEIEQNRESEKMKKYRKKLDR